MDFMASALGRLSIYNVERGPTKLEEILVRFNPWRVHCWLRLSETSFVVRSFLARHAKILGGTVAVWETTTLQCKYCFLDTVHSNSIERLETSTNWRFLSGACESTTAPMCTETHTSFSGGPGVSVWRFHLLRSFTRSSTWLRLLRRYSISESESGFWSLLTWKTNWK